MGRGLSKLKCENFLGDFMSKQVSESHHYKRKSRWDLRKNPETPEGEAWLHLHLVFFLGCLHILLKCLQARGRKKTFWETQIKE